VIARLTLGPLIIKLLNINAFIIFALKLRKVTQQYNREKEKQKQQQKKKKKKKKTEEDRRQKKTEDRRRRRRQKKTEDRRERQQTMYVIGVDVGGTNTDVVVLKLETRLDGRSSLFRSTDEIDYDEEASTSSSSGLLNIVRATKQPTTSDVTTGISNGKTEAQTHIDGECRLIISDTIVVRSIDRF